jgi:hypothetical protein
VSGADAGRVSGARSNVVSAAGEATAVAGAIVTFFGGQSMFLAKLGTREVVSSFWLMRVRPGTQTRTRTPSSADARASR